jgi:hypothetical protein
VVMIFSRAFERASNSHWLRVRSIPVPSMRRQKKLLHLNGRARLVTRTRQTGGEKERSKQILNGEFSGSRTYSPKATEGLTLRAAEQRQRTTPGYALVRTMMPTWRPSGASSLRGSTPCATRHSVKAALDDAGEPPFFASTTLRFPLRSLGPRGSISLRVF